MRRRELGAIAAAIMFRPGLIYGQTTEKIPHVGILWHAGSPEEEGILYRSMHQGFRDLGYIRGQNLIIEERFPGEIAEHFERFAKELVDSNPDVLIVLSIPSVFAIQKRTRTLPVVFLPITDPVALKLVTSLAHPGGNMTGLSSMGVDIAAKRVQLVKGLLPQVSRIALLCDPVIPDSLIQEIAESKAAGDHLSINMIEFEVHEVEQLEAYFPPL